MNSKPCYFCHVLSEDQRYIFEDLGHFTAVWDGAPITPGHATVIPKRHVQFIDQLTDDELQDFFPAVKKAVEAVRRTDFKELYTRLLETETDKDSREYFEHAIQKLDVFNTPPQAFNYGVNDGPEAGQTAPHVHFHIIPRWNGDVVDSRGGIRNMLSYDRYSKEPHDV